MNSLGWLSFWPPAKLLNLNDRMHWAQKGPIVKLWRQAAWVAGNNHKRAGNLLGMQLDGIVAVRCTFPVRSVSARRDPHNFVATVKPIIDGLTDAGLWPDDDSKHVAVLDPCFIRQPHQVVVDFFQLQETS